MALVNVGSREIHCKIVYYGPGFGGKTTNVVQIHEVGDSDGRPFFSLEFCPGGSLDRRLAGTPLPSAEAARLVELLAGAVQAAHDRGVLHRDLKPANVLLASGGVNPLLRTHQGPYGPRSPRSSPR